MKNLKIYTLGLIALLFFSCEREEEFEGPSLRDIYGEFAILEDFTISSTEVDFSTGEKLVMNARFSKITDWEITVSSSTNGAERILQGRSKSIDSTNAVWDGSADGFPPFSTGPCKVTLHTLENGEMQTRDVVVNGKRTPEGFVVADFENGIESGWDMFVQAGTDMSFVVSDTGVVPEGNRYFNMGGEVDWDWLIGYIDFPAAAYTNGFDIGNNANQLYFNVVVRKTPGLTNGIILFQFKEDDDQDGTFSAATEDLYSIEIRGKALTEDWSIYSIKYADLQSLFNGQPAEPKGDGQFNPDKLHTISCLFLANPSSGYSQADIDFVSFTQFETLRL